MEEPALVEFYLLVRLDPEVYAPIIKACLSYEPCLRTDLLPFLCILDEPCGVYLYRGMPIASGTIQVI